MLSQTMKFLLGSLFLALMISSQVQAAAIPVVSLRATDTNGFVPSFSAESNPALVAVNRRFDERRSITSLAASHAAKLKSLATSVGGSSRNAGNEEKKNIVDEGTEHKKPGIHHKLFNQMKTFAGIAEKKKEGDKPGPEPPKPHDSPAPAIAQQHPEGEGNGKSSMEKAKELAEVGTAGAGAVGAVGAAYKDLKGGGDPQSPAPNGTVNGSNAPA